MTFETRSRKNNTSLSASKLALLSPYELLHLKSKSELQMEVILTIIKNTLSTVLLDEQQVIQHFKRTR